MRFIELSLDLNYLVPLTADSVILIEKTTEKWLAFRPFTLNIFGYKLKEVNNVYHLTCAVK